MDSEGKAFPGLELIAEDSGYKIRRVREGIKRLEQAGLLKVRHRIGTSTEYTFPIKLKHFERFTPAFLKLPISPQAKEYYMDIQQYLYVDHDTGLADTTFSEEELAELTGVCVRTIRNYHKELIAAGLMHESITNMLSPTGYKIIKKNFDLYKLQQAVLYKLKDHEDRISTVEQKQADVNKELYELRNEVRELKEQLARERNIKDVEYKKVFSTPFEK